MRRRLVLLGDGGDADPNSAPSDAQIAADQASLDAANADAAGANYYLNLANASLAAAEQAMAKLNAAMLLGTLSASASAYLAAQNPSIPTVQVNGFTIPATTAAISAGAMAAANQIALEYAAGTLTLAQANAALAQLTPTVQAAGA